MIYAAYSKCSEFGSDERLTPNGRPFQLLVTLKKKKKDERASSFREMLFYFFKQSFLRERFNGGWDNFLSEFCL